MNDMYPFLISRNKAVDFRTVVAPAHLSDETAARLAEWVGVPAEYRREGATYRRDVLNTPEGDLTFFFKSGNDDFHFDHVGRPIGRDEGICLSKADASRLVVHSSYFDEVKRINDDHFSRFYKNESCVLPPARESREIASGNHLKCDIDNIIELPAIDLGGPVKSSDGVKKKIPESERDLLWGSSKNLPFKKVAAVCTAVVGVGLLTHGTIEALDSRNYNNRENKNGDRKSKTIALVEAGIGAGLTWVGFVKSTGKSLLGR